MYKCAECGAVFNDAAFVRECVGECHGSPYYETIAVCPDCGEAEFDEAGYCEECGAVCFADELVLSEDGDIICAECLEEKEEEPYTDFQAVQLNMLERLAR